VQVEKLGRASVEFLQQAWRVDAEAGSAATLLATGRIKVACVDQQTLRPKALPARVRRFIEGEPPM
jgi:acyl-CoA thioester hydrolase